MKKNKQKFSLVKREPKQKQKPVLQVEKKELTEAPISTVYKVWSDKLLAEGSETNKKIAEFLASETVKKIEWNLEKEINLAAENEAREKFPSQDKILDYTLDVNNIMKKLKNLPIFSFTKNPEIRKFKRVLREINPTLEFEKALLGPKQIELLKYFYILNTPEYLEKFPIFKKYHLNKRDQEIIFCTSLLLELRYNGYTEEFLHKWVFIKNQNNLPSFKEDILNNWYDVLELLEARETFTDRWFEKNNPRIKWCTMNNTLGIKEVMVASINNFFKSDYKEYKHKNLKNSTLVLLTKLKEYSFRYLNTFHNIDWDLSPNRFKFIRNTLSKDKTNKFNTIVAEAIDQVNNDTVFLKELKEQLKTKKIYDIIK